jgi:hypothetical membrane protein
MLKRRRLGLYCGLVAPAVSLVTNLLATLVDPEFSWTDKALSNLGEHPEGETFLYAIETGQLEFFLFNGGLILTATVGLGFARVLYDAARNALKQIGMALYALSLVLLGGVGVFHLPHDLHGPVAIAYFLLAPVSLVCYGAGCVMTGRRQFGILTMASGVCFVLSWFVWGIWFADSVAPNIAIPEFVSAIFFAGWTFGAAVSLLRSDWLAQPHGTEAGRTG